MKRPRHPLLPRSGVSFHRLFVAYLVFSCSIPGILSSRVVSLGSLEIFDSHEWVSQPIVYFHCKGENKTVLPDVQKTQYLYTFKGEESWQPLTELTNKKCKRCGLYEEDKLTSDDVFDEWELCPDEFVDGRYTHFKDKEFNATFICSKCSGSDGVVQTNITMSDSSNKKGNAPLVVIICVFASIVAVAISVVAYKYWQKRKREHDQARFLKLFEEGDDIEDELGLGHVI